MRALPIDPARLERLNDRPPRAGEYVLYWMQQSQRAEWNHALEYAAARANEADLPLLVGFGLMDDYPEANERHYAFMLEGLAETADALRARGADFVLMRGAPAEVALLLAKNAVVAVCDRGYLRHQREWRRAVAERAQCEVVQVEADVVAPVHKVSQKAEFAARTIRPKIHRLLEEYLRPVRTVSLRNRVQGAGLSEVLNREDLSDVAKLLASLKLDRSVPAVPQYFRGGTGEAKRRFRAFLREKLAHYAEGRNAPENEDVSKMAAYLHFGQISPLWMALELRKEHGARESADAYLEELIVRRELSMNFCEFNEHYDSYAGVPAWAREALAKHARDPRPHVYTAAELERGRTHGPYWNAAMREMRVTGYMHNHLRMYWGKKILEWSATPEEAFRTALWLNNRHFLCGRDPASYTNIAWLFGLHDRPWGERPIYGTVRCMMASGLERKSDIRAYVRRVEALPD